MSERILLVDIGNTRIKWATLRGGRLGRQRALVYAGWKARDFGRRVFASVGPLSRVVVASVAGARVEAEVRSAVKARLGCPVEYIRTVRRQASVVTRYREPWRLGVDRFVAAIAAHHLAGDRPACVISAGTAVTVDLIDGQGVHRGGLILPGPQLMVRSLLDSTSGIERRAQGRSGRLELFARSTRAAVEQGARYAVAAAADRAVEEARRRLRGDPLVLLTGGAATALRPLIRSRYRSVPDLVLRGVALYAGLSLDRIR
jgi:type III pantothenate kinase